MVLVARAISDSSAILGIALRSSPPSGSSGCGALRTRDGVRPVDPAPQVDQPATFGAEGEARQVGQTRRSRTCFEQIGQRPWIMKRSRSRWTSSWPTSGFGGGRRRGDAVEDDDDSGRLAGVGGLVGLGPLLVRFAPVVGLVEARPLEQDRGPRADLAAELGLGALGADRLGVGLDRLEGLELVVAVHRRCSRKSACMTSFRVHASGAVTKSGLDRSRDLAAASGCRARSRRRPCVGRSTRSWIL